MTEQGTVASDLGDFAEMYEHAAALPSWTLEMVHEGYTDGFDPLQFTATFAYFPEDDNGDIAELNENPYSLMDDALSYLEMSGWERTNYEHEDITSTKPIRMTITLERHSDQGDGESRFEEDIIETGKSQTARDRVKDVLSVVAELEDEYDEGAPIPRVHEQLKDQHSTEEVDQFIENLRQKGELYEPSEGHLRTPL